ncbi:MAG: hypothetical protein ACI90V_011396, partial [Bacillariaceae sp.]
SLQLTVLSISSEDDVSGTKNNSKAHRPWNCIDKVW